MLFLQSYTTILTAELLGDKTLYTITSLTTRYKTSLIFLGLVPAFMLKMAVAVLFGGLLSQVNPILIRLLTAATFLAMAVTLMLPARKADFAAPTTASHRGAILASFAAIFFTEWADIGQIAAATLAASTGRPLLVWCAATLALVTKAIAAATLGVGLRKIVPEQITRWVSIALFLAMAISTGLGIG